MCEIKERMAHLGDLPEGITAKVKMTGRLAGFSDISTASVFVRNGDIVFAKVQESGHNERLPLLELGENIQDVRILDIVA